jgi:hypothetical protein
MDPGQNLVPQRSCHRDFQYFEPARSDAESQLSSSLISEGLMKSVPELISTYSNTRPEKSIRDFLKECPRGR